MQFVVSGLLLDMDGTLIDSTPLVEDIWGQFADAHGLDVREILSYSHGLPSISTVRRALPDASPEQHQYWCDFVENQGIERLDGVVEVPGAGDFIRQAQSLGVPMSVVTSAPLELARRRFAHSGVPMPTTHITIESVTRGKPHPEPFLMGADALGLDPAKLLAFEDGAAGITSASDAGTPVVVVGDFSGPESQGRPRIQHWDQIRMSHTASSKFTIEVDQ